MDNNQKYRLYLKNIKQLVQISTNGAPFLRMSQCNDIGLQSNYSLLVDINGSIADIGPANQMQNKYAHLELEKSSLVQRVIDCHKYIVIPGFVDAHTHALFAGDRSKQYQMKLNGMGYVEIYNAGLGIRYSMESVRKASIQQLVGNLQKYLKRMSRLGTTTVQVKSGYGLDAQNQVKMLKAIQICKKKYEKIITIVSTFCGAHAIPKGKTQQQQTKNVIQQQIPAVKKAMQDKQISPVFIDVFCQKKFFETQSSIKIMQQGKKIGLVPSFHGDQLNNLQSGTIAVKVGARAVSHLQYVSEQSIIQMSKHNIACTLLPTTQNIQKLPIPPIASMRNHNSIVALGSDFCPNAFCYSMPLVLHYACTNYRLTPKQAIVAATLNSAYALHMQKQVGSLEKGKRGDLILMEAQEWVYAMYGFGDFNPVAVVKAGHFAWENKEHN